MRVEVKPQPGFQERFLSCSADILIAGGAAGAGKSYAELLEPLYHVENPHFGAEVFRRTTPQIKTTGGLWDQSNKIYNYFGAKSNQTELKWTFKSGATIKFSSLQYEDDVYGYQSASIPLICFDEVTHFTGKMFFYMMSRNRSTCGVRPYMRATCNPDPDSFLVTGKGGWGTGLISWWIDEAGWPIADRDGVIRYFRVFGEDYVWGDTKQDVVDKCAGMVQESEENNGVNPMDLVKSITFIAGKIYDNKILLKIDPGYLGNLYAQDEDTRAQLLEGNWKARRNNNGLFTTEAIECLFSNQVPPSRTKYITCDAARFGRDLCVIFVWGVAGDYLEVIHIEIWKKSDMHLIMGSLEKLRKKFLIPKMNVGVDRDGVGAAVVRQGGYRGFSGGDRPIEIKGMKESYKNSKTQWAYHLAVIVNAGKMRINVTDGSCMIDGQYTTKIQMGQRVIGIMQLIKEDFRSVDRDKVDMEGKMCIIPKEAQKIKLGRSPDFSDTANMIVPFLLMPKNIYL